MTLKYRIKYRNLRGGEEGDPAVEEEKAVVQEEEAPVLEVEAPAPAPAFNVVDFVVDEQKEEKKEEVPEPPAPGDEVEVTTPPEVGLENNGVVNGEEETAPEALQETVVVVPEDIPAAPASPDEAPASPDEAPAAPAAPASGSMFSTLASFFSPPDKDTKIAALRQNKADIEAQIAALEAEGQAGGSRMHKIEELGDITITYDGI